MSIRPASLKRISAVLLVCALWATNPPTTGAQGPAAAARLSHVVNAEPVLGTIRPRGFLPVRITIQRQGTQAVAQRNITYHIYQKDQAYRGNGLRTSYDVHRLVLARGTASASAVFLFRATESSGWDTGIHIETDGDLRNTNRAGDVGAIPNPGFLYGTSGLADAKAVRCLFVSSGRFFPKQQATFSKADLAFSITSAAIATPDSGAKAGEYPSDLDESEVPSAWQLRDVLAQDNQPRYDPWLGTTQTAEEGVVTRPGILDTQANLAALRQFEFMDQIPVSELPETWQGLVPVDYLFISAAELKNLPSGRPAAWQAIREWVAAGGRLVLIQCGTRCEALKDIERDWFDLGSAEVRRLWKRTSLEQILDSASDWGKETPAHELFSDPNNNPFQGFAQMVPPRNNNDPRLSNNGMLLSHCYLVAHAWSPESEAFGFDRELESGEALFADYGAGRIVATSGGCSTWEVYDWKTILATGLAGAPGPLLAHGMGPETGFDFPPTTMPGIGEPPWFLFMGLITVFAIGIGPVAYSFLAARKRIPWILGLVPIVAGTLTVGLLLFAILSEGLGTRVVRFGVSRIDASSGKSFTKTHLSVYSGISPGSYLFGDHKMVFPNLNNDYEFRSVHFGDSQQLSGGGIRARTIHQLVMSEPGPTAARLDVESAGDGGKSWTITNHTGGALSPVIAKTVGGWLFVESLSDGQSASVETIDSPALTDALNRMLENSGSRLGQLLGLKEIMLSHETNPWGRNPYQSWNYGADQAVWRTANDLWVPGLMTDPAALIGSIPAGGWIGMTSQSELAGRLANVANYANDFHVIHGRWK